MSKLGHSCGFLWNPEKREILLHLRDGNTTHSPNKWAFFGGGWEEGETLEECFVRELKEELNVEVKVSELKLVKNYINDSTGLPRSVYMVKSTLPKSAMTLSEGADFDWVPLDRALDLDLGPQTRKDLEEIIPQL
ncbi:MAG: NUDIX domain-containing protein [Candidatus Pacebacteria bacterium]|nr:NUDIX domain-containing protein [Candidatus Paceibacterota bacterium]